MTTLFLSPSTKAAQDHAVASILAAQKEHPLTPVCVLLPTTESVHGFRHRLGDAMGVYFHQFYSLAQAILDLAGSPVRRLSGIATRGLVHHILKSLELQRDLTTFAPIWNKPGFLQVSVEWLREMKTQGIWPKDVVAHAAISGLERDLQLGKMYLHYQRFLQQYDYSDADGLLWLAAEALAIDDQLTRSSGPFLALGFDQFNPIQIRILKGLSDRYANFSIYLRWDTNRTADSLPLVRLADTRAALQKELSPGVHTLEANDDQASALAHLRRELFEPGEAKVPINSPPEIKAISAPTRAAEARRALREVKQLLKEGILPNQIALLTPQPEIYQPILRAVAREYGVPLQIRATLDSNPAISAIINLLHLAPDFPWRETMDALRSPYVKQPWLFSEQINLLDQLSRERPVLAGQDQWSFALQPLDLGDIFTEDEDLGPPPLVSTLPYEELTSIHTGLLEFFDHLTPPESATYREYTLWIQEALLGLFPGSDNEDRPPTNPRTSLEMLACCQAAEKWSRRDLEAMSTALGALRDLIEAADIVQTEVDDLVTWNNFRIDFEAALSSRVFFPDPTQAAIRFGPLEMGRAMDVEYLILLGLSEGEFPKPARPDSFYAQSERENHHLPLIRQRPADDASLWWQVVGNCRRQLTLMRPRLDENGAPWGASPYWEAILDKLTGLEIELIPIKDATLPEAACSPSELLIALANVGAQKVPSKLGPTWEGVQQALAVIRQRTSWKDAGIFEGHFLSPGIKADLAKRFGPDHRWSVSRLNRFGNCPYGFFAQSVLGLEPKPDPEEGMDPLQRGSLLHALLEKLYKRLAEEGIDLVISNLNAILTILKGVCATWFPTAPQRYGFRPSALWRHEKEELHRLVAALIVSECEETGPTARFHPYLQEVRFGLPGGVLPYLNVQSKLSTMVKVHGVIDRIDRDNDGNLRVIDYKSGSTKFSKPDIEKGFALQTALYALVAERMTEEHVHVAASYYLHIPIRERSGKLEFRGNPLEDAVVRAAVDRATAFVNQVREGAFPSAPGKPTRGGSACSEFCDFTGLCRVTRTSIAKAQRRDS